MKYFKFRTLNLNTVIQNVYIIYQKLVKVDNFIFMGLILDVPEKFFMRMVFIFVKNKRVFL